MLGWVGTCLDLTDRKEAEQAILHESERFRAAFDDAPIGMALVAPDGTFLRVNQSLSAILGYSEADLLQRSFQELTHPDDLELDLEHAARVLAGELRTYQLEKRYRRADNEIVWAKLSVSLVRTSDGAPLYFVSQIEDITAQKEAERVLQHLADHDSLTGLLNRRRFYEELHLHLEQSGEHRPTGGDPSARRRPIQARQRLTRPPRRRRSPPRFRRHAHTPPAHERRGRPARRRRVRRPPARRRNGTKPAAQIADDVAAAIRQQTVPDTRRTGQRHCQHRLVTFRPHRRRRGSISLRPPTAPSTSPSGRGATASNPPQPSDYKQVPAACRCMSSHRGEGLPYPGHFRLRAGTRRLFTMG